MGKSKKKKKKPDSRWTEPDTPWSGSWAATVNIAPLPTKRLEDVPAIFRTDLPILGTIVGNPWTGQYTPNPNYPDPPPK